MRSLQLCLCEGFLHVDAMEAAAIGTQGVEGLRRKAQGITVGRKAGRCVGDEAKEDGVAGRAIAIDPKDAPPKLGGNDEEKQKTCTIAGKSERKTAGEG